jgi:hypothetical protein
LTQLNKSRGLFTVDVSSWDDIRDLLNSHQDVVSELYSGAAFAKDTKPIQDGLERIHRTLAISIKQDNALATLVTQLMIHSQLQGVDLSGLQSVGVTSAQVEGILVALNGTSPRGTRNAPKIAHPLLSIDASDALGLLSVSPVPFNLEKLEQLFPSIPWKRHFTYFRKYKLITVAFEDFYSAAPNVKRSLIKTEAAKCRLIEQWIDALRPVSGHPDTAILLAGHLISLKRTEEGVRLLVDASEVVVSGSWLKTYISVLLNLDRPRHLDQLSPSERVRYFNAVVTSLKFLYHAL